MKIFDELFQRKPMSLGSDVTVKEIPEDKPEFKREYVVRLNSNVTMHITIHNFIGSVMRQGELDQNDGKWVLFEPENPADKILDKELLPLVKSKCIEIIAVDQKFRNSDPDKYVDQSRSVWERKS